MSEPAMTQMTKEAAQAIFRQPIPPDFPAQDLMRHQSGAVMTSEGGIFLSVSAIKKWKVCKQKFLRANVQGLRQRIDDGNLFMGAIFGKGAEAWLLTAERKAALDAVNAEIAARSPATLIPEEQRIIDEYAEKARRWVNRFCEHYPQPHQEIDPIIGEGAFYVRLPGGPHWLMGLFDLPFLRNGQLGYTEIKTTSSNDKVGYLRDFEADEQILGYTHALGEIAKRHGIGGFGGVYLSVCVKPRARKKGPDPDPDFYSQMLMPTGELVDLWARQATIVGDEIRSYLEITEHPELWTRSYDRCRDYWRDCVYRGGCYQGEWGNLIEGERGGLMEPFKIIEKMNLATEQETEQEVSGDPQ